MKSAVLILLIVTVVVLVTVIEFARRGLPQQAVGNADKPTHDQQEFQKHMRQHFLQGSPEAFGILAEGLSSEVWGGLMEIGLLDSTTATVVCLGDGTAGLYKGSNGGTKRGDGYEDVGAASRRFLELAGSVVNVMQKAETYPMPKTGRIRFYIMTATGVFTADESEKTLIEGKHGLSPLYSAGNEVLSQMHEATRANSECRSITKENAIENPQNQRSMMKLYRRENVHITAYHEAWIDGSKIVEHWGSLGERGEMREHPRNESMTSHEALVGVLKDALQNGYQPIPTEELVVLLVEYRIEGMGSGQDLDKRHALEDRLDEALGWTGLGHCDGGSIGSGTMEACFFVVDYELAKGFIANNLQGTRFDDYSRIYRADAE
jgi:hypothetical protein